METNTNTKPVTYTVTAPNGQTFTRKSKRAYEYAVLAYGAKSGQFFLFTWNSNHELAQKSASKARNESTLTGWGHQHTREQMEAAKKIYSQVIIIKVQAK